MSSTTTPMGVKVLTVFHDLVACPLGEHEPQADMHQLLGRVDAVGMGALGARRARDLALEWRCVVPMHHALTPSMAEHFVDLGISTITAGRKAQAVPQKIRSDIAFFIESHSAGQEHAVVLAVSDASQFAGELRCLGRAGIRVFVVAAGGSAPTAVSSTCFFLGAWSDVVSSNVAAAATAPGTTSTTTSIAPAVWAGTAAGALDEAAVAAAINEAVFGAAAGGPSPAATVWAPPAAAWVPSSAGGAAAGATGSTLQSLTLPALPIHHQPLLLPSVCTSTPETKRGNNNSGGNNSGGNNSGSYSPPGRRWRRSPAAQPQRVDHTAAKLARGPVRQPAAAVGTAGAMGWMRGAATGAPVVAPNTSAAAAGAGSASSTAAFDPYRIIFGTLYRPSSGLICIMDRAGGAGHDIAVADLDFDYCWINQLPVVSDYAPAGAGGVIVCCRLHKSGRVTDIRMCGEVVRTIRKEFGFIRHELFPDNLYFRLADVDPTTTTTGAGNKGAPCATIAEGDVVAFRVGRKGQRKWAMRVWKTPAGTFEQAPAAAAAAAGAGAIAAWATRVSITAPAKLTHQPSKACYQTARNSRHHHHSHHQRRRTVSRVAA